MEYHEKRVEGLSVDRDGDVVFPKDSDFLKYLKRFCTMFQEDGNRYVKDFIKGGNIDDSVKLYCLYDYIYSVSQDNILKDLGQDYGFMKPGIEDEIALPFFKYEFKKYCEYILSLMLKYRESSVSKNSYILLCSDESSNKGIKVFKCPDYLIDRFNYHTNEGIDDNYELIFPFVHQIYEYYYNCLKEKYTVTDYSTLINELSKLRSMSPFAAGVAINEVARVASINGIDLGNVTSDILDCRSLYKGCEALSENTVQPTGYVYKRGKLRELE